MSFHMSAAKAGAVISGSKRRIDTMLLKRVGFLQQERDSQSQDQLESHGEESVNERDCTVCQKAPSVRNPM